MSLKSGAHTKYELQYHFVWCPKYRKILLKGNIANYMVKLVYEVAERYEYDILALAVMPDHIHLFASAPPHISPESLVRTIKSITARKLFARFPSIKRTLWGGALWERGYLVMSSGSGTTDEVIRRYIKEQR
ncbi:MAG: IS200/IS605 family transposase [Deltaproteobacteria bacterium]|nr:MAG: IS200/IS605 family transposase [Deltaproteobacteria bacterium]